MHSMFLKIILVLKKLFFNKILLPVKFNDTMELSILIELCKTVQELLSILFNNVYHAVCMYTKNY